MDKSNIGKSTWKLPQVLRLLSFCIALHSGAFQKDEKLRSLGLTAPLLMLTLQGLPVERPHADVCQQLACAAVGTGAL